MEANPYDLVPYAAYTFAITHPDRLATVACLRGMNPAPVDRCRVLELGSASGGNLIPMAESLPNSTFVGLDLSAKQVETANSIVSDVGLRNIQFLNKNILDVGPDLGTFDYIIAHGVYSWVPADARDKTLAICAANLSENGVAYVSYNTNPGWGLRSMIRQMMRYHTRTLSDPEQIVKQSRLVLDFLAASVPASRAHYAAILKDEIDLIKNVTDSYLFHDYHEPDNHPVFFHEFIDHAAIHNLQYLAEAEPRSTLAFDLAPDVKRIRGLKSLIEQEQYIDFLRYRGFRQTLLCHKNVQVTHTPDPTFLRGLFASSPIKPAAAVDPKSTAPGAFVDPKGNRFNLGNPLGKSILMLLGQTYPGRFLVDDLLEQAQQMSGTSPTAPPPTAAAVLMDAYLSGLVELHPRQVDFVSIITDHPIVRPLARLQARKTDRAANLLHTAIPLSPTARALFPLLDGQHTRADLLAELQRLLDADQLEDARPLRALPRDQQEKELAKGLDLTLIQIAAFAFLVA